MCPFCYDLPVRITVGNGPLMKEYGVHNGARGRIRSWTLHPDDVSRLANNKEAEVVLNELPLQIVLEMETVIYKKHPDRPDHYFPLKPVTNYWNLGGSSGTNVVEIRRRGYATAWYRFSPQPSMVPLDELFQRVLVIWAIGRT